MLIYADKAVEKILSGLTYDNITVVPIVKDKHNELREEQKYPCITWDRIDRNFDVSRYSNDKQIIITKDPSGYDIVNIYSAPNPYNLMYQIELISKERYDMDVMDVFIDEKINPRGNLLSIECFIEETNSTKFVKFPMRIIESRYFDDDFDKKNIYYRRIITISVQLFVDPLVLEDSVYMIKEVSKVQQV